MYVYVSIENFRLCAALRRSSSRARGPVVLVDENGCVAELNHEARAAHLLPGMTMARALSRCREMQVVHVDVQAERSAQRILWNAAWQITPQIELGEAGALGVATMELVRPDLQRLRTQVEELLARLRRCDLPARVGIAATPDWAVFAASSADCFCFNLLSTSEAARALLADLPISMLSCLSAHERAVVAGWGIHSLAELAALPRQALGERLGSSGLEAWDVLNGAAQRILRVRELAPDYRELFDLETPLQGLEALCFLVQRAAEALQIQLEQSGKMARALSIDLWMERGQMHRKVIRLPEATQRAALMERLIRNHLEQVHFKAPVVKFQLAVDPVDPLSRQAGLFERSVRNPWRLQETLDELAGLVGMESFGTPRVCETHRPDRYRLVTLPSEPRAAEASEQNGPPRMGPPLRRFRPPLVATVTLEAGYPVHVECALVRGRVTAFHGPYFLSGDWASATPWGLCEWDIEIAEAGVFYLSRRKGRWYLMGAYD